MSSINSFATNYRSFVSDLCNLSISRQGKSLKAQTQVTIEGGRPDMAIRNVDTYILFEAKVQSLLHDSQLVPYGRELENWKQRHTNGSTALFLIVPRAGSKTQIKEGQNQLVNNGISSIQLNLLTWEEIASFCADLETKVDDKRLAVYLSAFAELITRRIGEALRPFTYEEADLLRDVLTGQTIKKAVKLINRTKDILVSGNSVSFSVKSERGSTYDGYKLFYDNRQWFLGFLAFRLSTSVV